MYELSCDAQEKGPGEHGTWEAGVRRYRQVEHWTMADAPYLSVYTFAGKVLKAFDAVYDTENWTGCACFAFKATCLESNIPSPFCLLALGDFERA